MKMTHTSDKKILVVDDEPDVRNFLAACIEDAGFNVITAIDGMDALEKIAAHPPDLITLDMVMPRRSGIRVMRELKKNEKWAEIPVIVITAHARDEFGSRYLEEFTAFAARHRPKYTMEKPVTPQRLVNAICEILNVSPEEPDAKQANRDSGREDILKLIQKADSKTLKKVRSLLNRE
jgi:CheY-like chemotaxis protein